LTYLVGEDAVRESLEFFTDPSHSLQDPDIPANVAIFSAALRCFRPYPVLPRLPEGEFLLQPSEMPVRSYFVGDVDQNSVAIPLRNPDIEKFIEDNEALILRYQKSDFRPLLDRLCVVEPKVLWAMEAHLFQGMATSAIAQELGVSQSHASDMVAMGLRILGVTPKIRNAAEDRFDRWLQPAVVRFPQIARTIARLPRHLQAQAWNLAKGGKETEIAEKYLLPADQLSLLREELFFGRTVFSRPGFREEREKETALRLDYHVGKRRSTVREQRRRESIEQIRRFTQTGGFETVDTEIAKIIRLMQNEDMSLLGIAQIASVQPSRIAFAHKKVIAHLIDVQHRTLVSKAERQRVKIPPVFTHQDAFGLGVFMRGRPDIFEKHGVQFRTADIELINNIVDPIIYERRQMGDKAPDLDRDIIPSFKKKLRAFALGNRKAIIAQSPMEVRPLLERLKDLPTPKLKSLIKVLE